MDLIFRKKQERGAKMSEMLKPVEQEVSIKKHIRELRLSKKLFNPVNEVKFWVKAIEQNTMPAWYYKHPNKAWAKKYGLKLAMVKR